MTTITLKNVQAGGAIKITGINTDIEITGVADNLFATVTESKPDYILRLSEAEAKALRSVLRRVGGDPNTTPRGHIQSISAGLPHFEEWEDIEGSVVFHDEDSRRVEAERTLYQKEREAERRRFIPT